MTHNRIVQIVIIKIGAKLCAYYDLESKDDCPNETESEPRSPVDNVVSSQVFQLDSLIVQKGQGFVHIFEAVNSHLALGGPRL